MRYNPCPYVSVCLLGPKLFLCQAVGISELDMPRYSHWGLTLSSDQFFPLLDALAKIFKPCILPHDPHICLLTVAKELRFNVISLWLIQMILYRLQTLALYSNSEICHSRWTSWMHVIHWKKQPAPTKHIFLPCCHAGPLFQ